MLDYAAAQIAEAYLIFAGLTGIVLGEGVYDGGVDAFVAFAF